MAGRSCHIFTNFFYVTILEQGEFTRFSIGPTPYLISTPIPYYFPRSAFKKTFLNFNIHEQGVDSHRPNSPLPYRNSNQPTVNQKYSVERNIH